MLIWIAGKSVSDVTGTEVEVAARNAARNAVSAAMDACATAAAAEETTGLQTAALAACKATSAKDAIASSTGRSA